MSRAMRPIVICCLLLCTPPVWSQAGYAELTGEVRDASGAAVSKARVVVTSVSTGFSSSAETTGAGIYAVHRLSPGAYGVDVQAPGFRRAVAEDLQLFTGQTARMDFALAVGSPEETIEVHAADQLLNTEKGSLGQVISSSVITDLPLNGRTFVSLAALSPGVALPPGSVLPRINGGRPRTNEYLFDGISVLQPEPGQVAYFPVIDAIQEFKVEVNNPSAEFGRFNGGVVNLTTRSGSNQFHGSAFYFFRNEALNARNFFAPAGSAKPQFRRNQFGFVLGGPIVKNHTFFFTDYQGTLQSVGRVRISTVPTLLQRRGIFTERVGGVVPVIFDPQTTVTTPSGSFTRTPFPGNVIPANRFDSVAQSLLGRFPLPTLPGTANNFVRVGNETDNQHQFDVRLDHRFSQSDQVFGRYSQFFDTTDPVAPLPDGSGVIFTGAVAHTDAGAQAFASSYIHTFGAHMVNEVRFGYTRRSANRLGLMLESDPGSAIGLPGIPANGRFENMLPTFAIAGVQQLGSPANASTEFRTDVTELVDVLSLQRGRHSLKMGTDVRWERLDVFQPPSPTGLFTFSSLFTNSPAVSGSGFPLASFLLGQVERFSIDLQEQTLKPRAHIVELFVQDDWKIFRNFTLNAGVRYTLNFPSTEADDQGAVFNLGTQQLDYLGQNGFPHSARELHKLNFAPRLGFAYSPFSRLVVRSGYGVVFIEQAGITTPFTIPQFPFIQSVSQRTLDNVAPAFSLASGPSVAPIGPAPDAGLGQGVFSVNRKLGSGYVQQWNLAMQQEITPKVSVEVAYAGSKITRVGMPDTNLNQLTAEQLQLGSLLTQRVPNPFFGVIPRSSSLGDPTITRAQLLKPFPEFTTVSLYRNNVGNTNYHALQSKVEIRPWHGLFLLASYTRSKLIDEASSVFDASILTGPVANFPVADSFNRRQERDVSNGDMPNVFVASYVYDFPFVAHPANGSGLMSKLLGGWQVNGVVTVQSGLPVAVSQATNFNAFAGFGTQRPNLIGNPELPRDQRSATQFFDTAAFQTAPQFTLGSSSRNPVRGPAYRNWDFALIKRTPLSESVNFEFRTEVFNLTNTPALNAPNAVLGTPGFGSITSAGDPRVLQFGAKLAF